MFQGKKVHGIVDMSQIIVRTMKFTDRSTILFINYILFHVTGVLNNLFHFYAFIFYVSVLYFIIKIQIVF